jgi:hypothetical protein
MANKEGEKRFQELHRRIIQAINDPTVNHYGTVEGFYSECRVLVAKFATNESTLAQLDEMKRRHMYLNNFSKLEPLAEFVQAQILDQSIDDPDALDLMSDEGSIFSKYMVQILFLILFTYINLTIEKVWEVDYDSRWKWSMQTLIVAGFVISLFKKVPEKVSLIIQIIIGILVSLIPTLSK